MRSNIVFCGVAAACVALAGTQAAGAPDLSAARYGTWGVDLAGRDLAVKPGDDFNRYAGGSYLKTMQIPPDRSRYGSFDKLRELSENRVRAILEEMAASAPRRPTSEREKIGAFYRAYLDEGRVNALGVQPLAPALAAVRDAPDRSALAALMGRSGRSFMGSLFGLYVSVDSKNPDQYVLYLSQGGLGMPERDYYLKPAFADKLAAYEVYVARLLELSGWAAPQATAKAVVAFETGLAEDSWAAADRRNPDATYNPMTPADLASFAPGFDWGAFIAAAEVGKPTRMIVREKSAFPKLAARFGETPLNTLKAWAAFHLADDASPYLSEPFVQARFEFRTRSLSGAPALEARWKRAVNAVGDLRAGMGDAVGKLYVARYFPPSSKAKMETLVENLRGAFRRRIEASTWMSAPTKSAALEKLAAFQIKIGYTSEWRSYGGLEIDAQDLFGDVDRAQAANWRFETAKLGQRTDRAEWHMTPQTVNAYNNSTLNEVVFPAAILQPPFFDPDADPAVNYGGIVAVIGHEMTHGFDDQGRKFDAKGRLRDWWTPEDAAAFDARAQRYGAEFAAYDTGVGVRINPKLTMGENIADLGGLNLALDAYHHALGGRPAPVIDGLTGDQRFFLAWAQVWRAAYRPDALKRQMASDPHSPDMYRANTAERNMDAWYAAFNIKPGDALYIAPQDRVVIW